MISNIFEQFLFEEARAFSILMVVLEPLLKDRIIKWTNNNIFPQQYKHINQFRTGLSKREDLHITVRYGLYMQHVYQLLETLEKFPPLSYTLGKITLFKLKNYDVATIKVISKDIEYMHSFINSTFYSHPEPFDFNPHVTLAYVQPDSCNHLEGSEYFNGLKYKADFIRFKNKQGLYRDIRLIGKEWPSMELEKTM